MHISTTTRKFAHVVGRHRIISTTCGIVALGGLTALSVMALEPPHTPTAPSTVVTTPTHHTLKPKAAPAKKVLPKPVQPAPPKPQSLAVAPAPAPKPAPAPAPTQVAKSSAAPKPASSLAPAPAPTQPTPPAPTVPQSPSYTSSNWAGYMASTQSYTTVSGTWTIPTATGSAGTTSADATWIGIGGAKSSDLIQIGTENTVSPQGVLSSAVFYEMLPAAAVFPTSIIVTAGDTVSAALTETSPDVWLATITDDTTDQSFSVTLNYASTNSSSEWIQEDPSYSNGQLAPLDRFGSVTFNGGTTTANNTSLTIAKSGAGSVTLVTSGGSPLISVSSLTADGGGFTATEQ